MLDDVSSATGLDFNYNVTVYSKESDTIVGEPISVTSKNVLNPKNLSERTIQVFSGKGANNSFVRIAMKE